MLADAMNADVTFALPANIAFGITAALMVYAAIRVVTTKNVVHAALFLVLVLGGVAINYLLLQSEFLAITQFLVYIGAIIVLFLFGIMLTKAALGESDELDNAKLKPVGVLAALVLAATVGGSLIATFKDREIPFVAPNSTEALSDAVFSTYLLPFEIVSVLLLAALIGAIVLARKD